MLGSSSLSMIVGEIKEMNTIFERPEGMGANKENEFSYFLEEISELEQEGVHAHSLIGALDAMVDICVFAVGVLHKEGGTCEKIVQSIQQGMYVNIRNVTDAETYIQTCANILKTVIESLYAIIGEERTVQCFHEVYLSNMSKLKDGKPVSGNLPGKFGKNMETYFKPNLSKYLI